uniref:CHK domain-containing protein n=1 Tax=Macrostomum lignano TaxID=282301 RepID=A0A1I8GQF0_9PLAT
MDCFCPRECLFYGTFAPLLERTASQLGLGSVGLPSVHLEMVLPTGTLIVMEDLGEAGFELAPATMNVAEARCVLSSLARVQAAFWLTKARLGSPASGLFGPQSPLSDGFFALSATKKSMDELLPAGFELFRREFGNRDASGQPVECRLIDWQVFGIGRLTFDLGPFWISSIDNAIAVDQYLPCVELYDETIRSLYKTGLQQEFPVSKETIRQQAVQSLNWGITWLVTFAEMIPVLRRIDNVLNNVADLIEHFGFNLSKPVNMTQTSELEVFDHVGYVGKHIIVKLVTELFKALFEEGVKVDSSASKGFQRVAKRRLRSEQTRSRTAQSSFRQPERRLDSSQTAQHAASFSDVHCGWSQLEASLAEILHHNESSCGQHHLQVHGGQADTSQAQLRGSPLQQGCEGAVEQALSRTKMIAEFFQLSELLPAVVAELEKDSAPEAEESGVSSHLTANFFNAVF